MKPRSSKIVRASVVLTAVTVFATMAISERASAELLVLVGAQPLVTRTWDGGGATNNWSDAANWSGDVAPGSGDDVIFDSTSSKDATIDTNFSISSLQIIAGYAGTISQGSSVLSLGGVFAQAGGTFDGGSGVLNLNSNFTVSNGSFIPSSGTVAFAGAGAQSLRIPSGFALNNLTVNKANNSILTMINGFVVPINGTLSLIDGQVHRNSFDGLDARGDVLIAPTFDGTVVGNPPAFLNITGTATRTVTFPVGAKNLPVTVNAPNVSLNASGAGTITFDHPVNVQSAAGFTNGDVNFIFASSLTTNGFTQGAGNLTFNSGFTQTGGTFTLGSGSLTFNSAFVLNGGTFNAPAGALNFPSSLLISSGAIFNHNNGTIVFNGSEHQSLTTPPGLTFNNVTVNKADNKSLAVQTSNTITILGTLNLTDGGVDLNVGGTKIDAQGDVFMSPTFDGSPLNQPMNLQVSGSATRTLSFPVGAQMLPLIVNAPNVTVTNHGTGTFTYRSVDLQSAAGFTNADVDLIVNGAFTLGAATVTQGSGDINFLSGGYVQNAGAFVPGSGALSFGSSFGLFGGTFTAPTSTISFQHEFRVEPAATFNPNGGTVQFNGTGAGQLLRIPTTFALHNVNVSRQSNTDLTFFNSPSTLVATGTLQLLDGRLQLNSIANVDAQGDVLVGPLFDGGQMSNIRFTGSANQTYTNNGGVNPTANWRINKAPTAIVAAATSLGLTAGQQLFIDSGILYLNENSNLTTSNLLTIASAGKLINDSATTITLGGNLTNSGTVSLNGSGASCPDADTILVRSTNATQRIWTGGSNRLIDVDIQDMGGTGTKTVFNGTDSGGNNASWIFDTACPPPVTISPVAVDLPAGTNQIFTAGGGVSPYTFSLAVNNSGGTIGASTGSYTAGAVIGVSDTIRVTDAFGSTADANVTIVASATRLGFIVHPSDAPSGQTITPPIKVAVQDSLGNTVTNSTAAVTLAIQNIAGSGQLAGTLTTNAIGGIATFDNVRMQGSGAGYTLRATSPGLTTGLSNAFNIGTGGGTQLAFVVQPSNTAPNTDISPFVQVAIQDAAGNTATTAIVEVTLTLGSNPGPGVLSGTISRFAVAGIATFPILRIDTLGSGYTLVARSGSLTAATSSPFDVVDPLIVTNINNTGLGSLRYAINSANSTAAPDTIRFNIAGTAPFVINVPLVDSLPSITASVTIDGTSQPGYVGVPLVEVRGTSSSPVNGFTVNADTCTIQGLAITGFGPPFSFGAAGVYVLGDNASLLGNYIGLETDGATARGNEVGVIIDSGASNTFVGANTSQSTSVRNTISGNRYSIIIFGPNNRVENNYIGTNAAGTSAVPNTYGVSVLNNGNTVRDNVISGNTGYGISFLDSNTQNGLAERNRIGLAATTMTPIPNGGHGISVPYQPARGVRLSQNRIFGNADLGIRLGSFNPGSPGVPNDPQDSDAGANGLQNYPDLTKALQSNGATHIFGSLNSTPSSPFRLEFFSSPSCDSSGNGEGETFIGSVDVVTTATGYVDFASQPVTLPLLVPNGRFITATATDANGSTSEFSKCQVVGERFEISGRVTDGTLPLSRVQVQVTAATGQTRSVLTNGTGNYTFTSLPRGSYTLAVVHPSLTFTPATRTFSDLSQNQLNQDFNTLVRRFTLRGQARTSANGFNRLVPKIAERSNAALPPIPTGGFPLLGVTFNVVGPGVNRNVTSDSFGNYRFDALPPASYVLTPTKPNYVFNPPLANVTIGSNETVDFEGTSQGLSTLFGRIVYDSLGGIMAMNADGSGLVTLTPNSTRIATRIMPRLSENGQRIAFISRSVTSAKHDIYTLGADGTARQFLYTENAKLFSPVHSPDGTRIAFHNNSEGLVVVNADGSNVRSVRSNCSEPDWAPDGTRIVCVEEVTSAADRIITVNVDTGQRIEIDNTSGRKFSPRWSPDGTKVAFIRRQSGTPATHSIVVRDLLAGSQTIMSGTNNLNATLSWSPDSARLLFIRDSIAGVGNLRPPGGNNQLVTIQASDGQNMLVIVDGFDGERVDWGNSNSFATLASPTPTVIQSGAVSISFPSTSGTNAFTTITPIEPNSAGTAPNGFVIGGFAFEINTTAGFTPPVTICIDLDDPGTQLRHSLVSGPPALMHNENGMLVNITTSYDPQTEILCGQTNSFSPFVVAEQVDTALPSITGLVIDSNGDPMGGVLVSLTGAETDQTQTDSNGLFTFVNLIDGANYNVQPQKVGYLFNEYSQDLLAVTGENTVVFTGTAGTRQISGRVADSLDAGVQGVTITLDGSTTGETVTDVNGNYVFTDLPTDGAYFVSASRIGLLFTPAEHAISPLISDVSETNFTAFAPTAANVSVGGRVLNAAGLGIGNARLTISDARGNTRTALTNPFGHYRFDEVEIGGVYVISVEAKRHHFENPTRTVNVVDELTDVNFVALPESLGAG